VFSSVIKNIAYFREKVKQCAGKPKDFYVKSAGKSKDFYTKSAGKSKDFCIKYAGKSKDFNHPTRLI